MRAARLDPSHRPAPTGSRKVRLGLAACLFAGSGCASIQPEPTDTFPSFRDRIPSNVLMVSIETLRRDHLARYGAREAFMPFLEGLAAEGVVLDAHRSCTNWTFPAAFCYATGADATHAGWVPRYDAETRAPMPDLPTLAAWLSEAGFHTMLFSTMSWLSSQWNTDAGFQESTCEGAQASVVWTHGLEAVETARARGVDRWFLHLHLKEPHSPYTPPEAYLGGLEALEPIPYDLSTMEGHDEVRAVLGTLSEDERRLVLAHVRVRYEGEMRWLDDQLREAWQTFQARGLLDDTLVVFWSDHGEQFWDHGEIGHAHDLHVEETDALAFFWARNILPDTWDGLTAHPDLTATLLALEGIDSPPEVSGLPVGTAPQDRPWLGWTAARLGPVQAVVLDGFKLIYRWKKGDKELYDLKADPTETVDLYAPDHPEAIRLWERLLPEVEAMASLVPEYTPFDPGP